MPQQLATSRSAEAVAEAVETISANCLAARIRLLLRTITGIFDEALRPLGLTDAQLTILVVIAKRGPVSPGALARRLNMEKSTLSRNIARMAKNGWLTVAEGESGREQRLTVNARGRTLLVRALPVWNEAQIKAKAVLGQRGASSIISLGNSVWSQLGRD